MEFFCPFLCNVTFYILVFVENHSIALYQLFTAVFEGWITNQTLLQHLPLYRKPFWGTFGLVLVIASILLELFPIFLYEILQVFLALPWQSMCQQKLHSTRLSVEGTMQYFLRKLLNVLRNLKVFIDIIHEYLQITTVVSLSFEHISFLFEI